MAAQDRPRGVGAEGSRGDVGQGSVDEVGEGGFDDGMAGVASAVPDADRASTKWC
jgi:hypothetical protein